MWSYQQLTTKITQIVTIYETNDLITRMAINRRVDLEQGQDSFVNAGSCQWQIHK